MFSPLVSYYLEDVSHRSSVFEVYVHFYYGFHFLEKLIYHFLKSTFSPLVFLFLITLKAQKLFYF